MKKIIALMLAGALLFLPIAHAQWAVVLAGRPPTTSSTTFVTGQTLGTPRSNGGGYDTGFKLLVGASPITVTHLGRYKAAGDSATHAMYIRSLGGFASLASATVDMSGTADAGGYVYVALGTPYVLSAATSYYFTSTEEDGVDTFHNSNTSVTTTAVGSVTGWVYHFGGSGADSADGLTYGPVTFKYSSP